MKTNYIESFFILACIFVTITMCLMFKMMGV